VAAPKTRKPAASKAAAAQSPAAIVAGGPGDTLPAATLPSVPSGKSRGMIEAEAFSAELATLAERGAALGNEALTALFQLLGKSTDKGGRPQVIPTCAVQMAMQGRSEMTFQQRVQLANTANKAAASWAKPCFAVRSKAGTGDGSASYRLNMPSQLSVDIA
jgi:hypothetical protein